MITRLTCAAIFLIGFQCTAQAQIYKCKGSNGESVFQDQPCPTGTKVHVRNLLVAGEQAPASAIKDNDTGPGDNWGPRVQMPVGMQFGTQQNTAGTRPAALDPSSWQAKERDYKKRHARDQAKVTAQVDPAVKAINCNSA